MNDIPSAPAQSTVRTSPPSTAHRDLRGSRAVFYGLLATFGVAIDLWTKEVAFARCGLPGEHPPTWIIPGFFGFETAVNHGAVFGIGQGYGWVFAIVSIVAMLGIAVWLFAFRACQSLWLTVALGMITGGILGNLYDRLGMHGLKAPFVAGVRDWILFRFGSYTYPNFNIADSLLVVGAIMLAIHSFYFKPPIENAAPKA
jgi:signal peptidase II